MNVLDENILESQRAFLRAKRVALRQIGDDLGRKGMQDREIVALLHEMDRPSFFTRDGDFYDPRLCHKGYCLVHLAVDEGEVAGYVLRLLRHRELNTRAKRMGHVIRVMPSGLTLWRIRQEQERRLSWR